MAIKDGFGLLSPQRLVGKRSNEAANEQILSEVGILSQQTAPPRPRFPNAFPMPRL